MTTAPLTTAPLTRGRPGTFGARAAALAQLAALATLAATIATALAAAPAVGATAASRPGAADTTGLRTDLQAILAGFLAASPQAPGACIWVACPALGLDWQGASGRAARGDEAPPLTRGHTFRIASNTKTYVAATVLRLVEDRRLTLDDPLAAALPPELSAPLAADGYDLGAMTLRQVLSHTAGLADHSSGDSYGEQVSADPRHRWTPLEQVRRCADLCDPLGAAPAPFRYSDTGYVLLGAVVERATGSTLAAAVRRELGFARLGLDHTWWETFEPTPAGAGPRAHQHIGDHDVTDWDPSFDLYGGGGLVSDARDLGRFLRLLVKGRVLRTEAALAAMTGDGTAGYRLGLFATELDGRLALGHTGFWNTFAFHVPSLDATLAGSILSHDAAKGRELAERLVARLAVAATATATAPAAAR